MGGIAAVVTFLAAIWVYIQVWDPRGSGEYGDPFAGLPSFLLILVLVLAAGSGFGIVMSGRFCKNRSGKRR